MDSQRTPTLKLVLTDGPVDRTDALDSEVELGFRFDELLALNPDIQVSDSLMAEHLAHTIAATPTNLLCHTQRVFFHYKNGDSDGLYSALLDLFIAMDSKGTKKGAKLRRRLLKGSRGRLLPEHFGILSRWLEQGPLAEEKDFPPASQSTLSRGITGTTKLVQVFHTEDRSPRNSLQEAREHIEYFQIEEARKILEAAILEQPEWEELHIELVHLYQATRDVAGLQAMREKLSQIMPELPHCWRPLGGENP